MRKMDSKLALGHNAKIFPRKEYKEHLYSFLLVLFPHLFLLLLYLQAELSICGTTTASSLLPSRCKLRRIYKIHIWQMVRKGYSA